MFFLGKSDNVKGLLFPLREGKQSLGSHPKNEITVPDDPGIEETHLHIEINHDNAWLLCLKAPVFLNGGVVQKASLKDGDEILFGETVLKFYQDEKSFIPFQSNMPFLSESKAYFQSEINSYQMNRLMPVDHLQKKLSLIYELGHDLNAASSEKVLLEILVDFLKRALKTDRRFIFLWNARDEKFDLKAGMDDQEPQNRKEVKISQTVISRILREKKAFLCQDIFTDEHLKESDSLKGQCIHSILCAPLLRNQQILGIIYLDAFSDSSDFNPHNLEFLCAVGNQISVALENLRTRSILQIENEWLKRTFKQQSLFIGESPKALEIMKTVKRIAPTNLTVLIRGETGTGKELIAQMIHQLSPRKQSPFQVVNCAALSESLLESELFGHEKGSFSGASERKTGKFEIPEGGTLFLDEIGEISPKIQVKLLRFLQDFTFERVGGTKPITVNVRILAATNRDLEKAVKEGHFREDLYYRLQVVQLDLPPLRERLDDFEALALHFIDTFSSQLGRQSPKISPDYLETLQSYPWPGNIRQLKNAIERSLVFCTRDTLLPEDLPCEVRAVPNRLEAQANEKTPIEYKKAFETFEKDYLEQLMKKAKGHITQASELSGIDRSHLHKKLKKHEVKHHRYKAT